MTILYKCDMCGDNIEAKKGPYAAYYKLGIKHGNREYLGYPQICNTCGEILIKLFGIDFDNIPESKVPYFPVNFLQQYKISVRWQRCFVSKQKTNVEQVEEVRTNMESWLEAESDKRKK